MANDTIITWPDTEPENAPTAKELIEGADGRIIAVLVVTSVLAVVSWINFALHATEHRRAARDIMRYRAKIVIIACLPVVATLACFAIYVMRAVVIVEIIQAVYEGVALYYFGRLFILMLGGREVAARTLSAGGEREWFAVPPLCCCCGCMCPKMTFDKAHLRILRWSILQIMFVRPALLIVAQVIYGDGEKDVALGSRSRGLVAINLGTLASMLLCMWALFVLLRASRVVLPHYSFGLKFLALKLILLISILQTFFFVILLRVDAFDGTKLLNKYARANMWRNLLLVLEATLFIPLFRKAYPASDHDIDTAAETMRINSQPAMDFQAEKVAIDRNSGP